MINEILQWIAILSVFALLVYPTMRQVVKDFKEEDEEE